MTTDPTTLESAAGHQPRLTRRQALFGGGAGLAALALARVGSGSVGATSVAGQLNEPGSALETATRVTTTTTTTTTVPPSVPELADGEILFPILVGADDDCYVLDNYGDCRGSGCSRLHQGVDIMADLGLPVIAVADGTLTRKYEDSGSCGGAGNGWTLTDDANDIVYKFFHLDRHEEGLEVGDTVTVGQIIGYVGETGTSGVCSTTSSNHHLHFEYRPGNNPRDSFGLLQRAPNVTFA